MNLGLVKREQGDLAGALALSEAALSFVGEQEHPYVVADIYNHLGTILALDQQYGEARRRFQATLRLMAARITRQGAEAKRELARLSLMEGKYVEASRLAGESLAYSETLDDKIQRSHCAVLYAQALISTGRSEEAVPYLEQARCVFAEVGMDQSLALAASLLDYVTAQSGDIFW